MFYIMNHVCVGGAKYRVEIKEETREGGVC